VPSNATIGSWYVLSVTATVGGVTDTVYSDPFEVVPLVAGLVVPLRSTAGEERLLPGKITVFLKERMATEIRIVDELAQPVDCTGKVCDLIVEVGGQRLKISDLSPTGTPPHKYAFTPVEAMTAAPGFYGFALRRPVGAGYEVVGQGELVVLSAVAE